MRLHPSCARCGAPLVPEVGSGRGRWTCPLHQAVELPCWRPSEVTYESFAEHLVLSRGLPTWLTWPLPPGWAVADFGCVGAEGESPHATFATCQGLTPADGGVALTVVTEEPGVGLGAHLAGVTHSDPGREAWNQPAALRLRLGGLSVPLWPVPTVAPGTGAGPQAEDRTVLAGEAHGRWLWVVVTPAEAVLGLVDRASLVDASELGPELLAVGFGPVMPEA
jgi:hypothetical protein